ncbi:MAG: hypothetical protein LBR12_00685 [Opitutaceae bacterium]|nr:hypothetical protein [Opitutaceae bacterium]
MRILDEAARLSEAAAEQVARMREADPGAYVPLQRELEREGFDGKGWENAPVEDVLTRRRSPLTLTAGAWCCGERQKRKRQTKANPPTSGCRALARMAGCSAVTRSPALSGTWTGWKA